MKNKVDEAKGLLTFFFLVLFLFYDRKSIVNLSTLYTKT